MIKRETKKTWDFVSKMILKNQKVTYTLSCITFCHAKGFTGDYRVWV